jgi:plasmid stabilization system protein ParE
MLPEAEQEIREAFLWYFERSPIAADAFRSLVFEAIDGLADRADM